VKTERMEEKHMNNNINFSFLLAKNQIEGLFGLKRKIEGLCFDNLLLQ